MNPFEKTQRNEKSVNNIKNKLLLVAPDNVPDALIKIMQKWQVVSKSPYSNSFYDITNKSWDDTHHDSFFRVADHWNFTTQYGDDIHCKTNKPVKNNIGYHLAKYNPKTDVYEIIKFFPYETNHKIIKARENENIKNISKLEPFEKKILDELSKNDIMVIPAIYSSKFTASHTRFVL